VQVVSPTPQAAGRLLGICPYVAEFLAVWQRLDRVKISCDFVDLGNMMNKDKLMLDVPSANDQWLVVII
jgi:hypothetical protein